MKAKQLLEQLTLIVESGKDPEINILAKGDLFEEITLYSDADEDKIVMMAYERRLV